MKTWIVAMVASGGALGRGAIDSSWPIACRRRSEERLPKSYALVSSLARTGCLPIAPVNLSLKYLLAMNRWATFKGYHLK